MLVHSHFSCHIFLFQNIFVDPLTPLVHMKNLNLMVLKRSDLCFETRADTHNHIQNIIFNRSTTKHSLKFDSRLYKFMIEVSCFILFSVLISFRCFLFKKDKVKGIDDHFGIYTYSHSGQESDEKINTLMPVCSYVATISSCLA